MNCPECNYPMRFVDDIGDKGKKLYECQNNTCPNYIKAGWRFRASK